MVVLLFLEDKTTYGALACLRPQGRADRVERGKKKKKKARTSMREEKRHVFWRAPPLDRSGTTTKPIWLLAGEMKAAALTVW